MRPCLSLILSLELIKREKLALEYQLVEKDETITVLREKCKALEKTVALEVHALSHLGVLLVTSVSDWACYSHRSNELAMVRGSEPGTGPVPCGRSSCRWSCTDSSRSPSGV